MRQFVKMLFLSAVAITVAASLGAGRAIAKSGLIAPPPSIKIPEFGGLKPCEVVSVVDGDTVTVLQDGKNETVRLLGVDTPETKDPRKPVEFFGKEAAAFTTNLLLGESVYVVEEQPGKRDKYGRVLAHLYRAPDGLWVNLELIRQGYAQVYSGEAFQDIDLFLKYQARARQPGKGLWSEQAKEGWKAPATPATPPPASTPTVPAPAVKEPQPEAAKVTVYVTRSGTKYHSAGCSYLKSSIPIELSEARRRYSACSRCNPPR